MNIEKKAINYCISSTRVPKSAVENTIELLTGGATIPFLARYRKELTGNLDEVHIEALHDAYAKYTELEKRKESILPIRNIF